jgi:hypothetical protein
MLPALAVLAVLSQANEAADSGRLPPPPPQHPGTETGVPPGEPVKTPVPKQDTYEDARAPENQPDLAGANPQN